MKKFIVFIAVMALAIAGFSQMQRVAKIQFQSDSAGSQLREYFLDKVLKSWSEQEVQFKNYVLVTEIFNTDTVQYGYYTGFSLSKADSILISGTWKKGNNYYNNFNPSLDENKFIKLNRQLIYNQPNKGRR